MSEDWLDCEIKNIKEIWQDFDKISINVFDVKKNLKLILNHFKDNRYLN